MRFKCSQQQLLHALENVVRVIDANATLPVLNNILVRAQGKHVYFSATNLELAVKYSVEAEILNEGAITVPAKLFLSYIQLLTDTAVDVVVDDGLTLSVKSASSKTKIKCIAAEEFPSISTIDPKVTAVIQADGFPLAIGQVVFAAATQNTRPALAGIYLDVSGTELKMVTTDSYRLSEKKITLVSATGTSNCIVPSRAMAEVARLIPREESIETIILRLGENQAVFEIGKLEFYSRLIDGRFPVYNQIIPQSFKSSCTVALQDFTIAVKRVNLFARENNNKIILELFSDHLRITTPATQVGEEDARVTTSLSGDPNKTALNGEYLLQLLSNVYGNDIEMCVNDDKGPPLFRTVGDDTFVHIIMPLRVG